MAKSLSLSSSFAAFFPPLAATARLPARSLKQNSSIDSSNSDNFLFFFFSSLFLVNDRTLSVHSTFSLSPSSSSSSVKRNRCLITCLSLTREAGEKLFIHVSFSLSSFLAVLLLSLSSELTHRWWQITVPIVGKCCVFFNKRCQTADTDKRWIMLDNLRWLGLLD